ncbi:MAG: hypothetical protein ACRDL5_15490, partial [Solirubrobacteraceae bacterium]
MMSEPVQVLIVAHQTAQSARLREAVRVRAAHGPAEFHLLMPREHPHGKRKLIDDVGLDDEHSRRALAEALPALSQAAGGRVGGSLGVPGPMTAIEAEIERGSYDEIIISTLPRRFSRWLKADLVSKARGLG